LTQFVLTGDDDFQVVTVLVDGELRTADSSHINFRAIVDAAQNGDPDIAELFDTEQFKARVFTRLSDRITVEGDNVYLDSEPVHGLIADHILRGVEYGVFDIEPTLNFLENMATNPNPESVEQLYNWLDANDGFTITNDGMIVGYKGVAKQSDGSLVSVNSGKAIVDGAEVTGQIPNYLGAVVEMPRSEVEFNPSRGCSTGLHVGTYDYATGWAQGALLEVIVNPRDVVSVPSDCSAQKMRCSRYEVVGTIDHKIESTVRDFDGGYGSVWGDGEGEDEPDNDWLDLYSDEDGYLY
jgi:hypothetical protein